MTYSTNFGNPSIEATNWDSLQFIMEQLPDNTAQLISPKDVRDAIFTTWETGTFKVIELGSENYIGTDNGGTNNNFRYKMLFGKKELQPGNTILNNTLLNSDTDIFIYNNKSDSNTSLQDTKMSFLAGDDFTIFPSAPYIESTKISGLTPRIDLNITNPSTNGIIEINSSIIELGDNNGWIVDDTNGSLYPQNNGQNIGLSNSTNRIGTIYMSSTVDYLNDLEFVSGTSSITFDTDGMITTKSLYVEENLRFQNSPLDGYFLSTDTSGNATWAPGRIDTVGITGGYMNVADGIQNVEWVRPYADAAGVTAGYILQSVGNPPQFGSLGAKPEWGGLDDLVTDSPDGYVLTSDGNKSAWLPTGIELILRGTQYLYAPANGTDTENASTLQQVYNEAKTMSPSINNRITVIAGPGNYNFGSDTFEMDTEYIDLVPLDGNKSIVFNAPLNTSARIEGSINITGNDVFVRGVNVRDKSFKIGDNLNLLRLEKCEGGQNSFGSGNNNNASGTFIECKAGSNSFGYVSDASGTFIDCEALNFSFGSRDVLSITTNDASGTFENCKANNNSFGYRGSASGTFINCESGDDSFGSHSSSSTTDFANGTFKDCQAGNNSFGYNIEASGTFNRCQSGNNSFGSFSTVGSMYSFGEASGTFIECEAGNRSFGWNRNASGTFTNCKSSSGSSFGSGILSNEEASGIFRGCISGNNSFGSELANGTFIDCESGDGSFGNQDASGIFRGCISGNNSFGGELSSGTFVNCEAGNRSFGWSLNNTATPTQEGGVMDFVLLDGGDHQLSPGQYSFDTDSVSSGSGLEVIVDIDGNGAVVNVRISNPEYPGFGYSVGDIISLEYESVSQFVTLDAAQIEVTEVGSLIGNVSGTFINCQALDESFGFNIEASGKFKGCLSGDNSFGGGKYGFASGDFTECESGISSFGPGGASGNFNNCISNGTIQNPKGLLNFDILDNGSDHIDSTFLLSGGSGHERGQISITVQNNVITNIDITRPGIGYIVGDIFNFSTSFSTNDAKIILTEIIEEYGSFGHWGDASGNFNNCESGNFSFGYSGNASGNFTNCKSGSFSFGGYSNASGNFENCVSTPTPFGIPVISRLPRSLSFGCNNYTPFSQINFNLRLLDFKGQASGVFNNCKSDGSSFGYSGSTTTVNSDASGFFTNCVSTEMRAFGFNGDANGTFKNCVSAQFSFGRRGDASGNFDHCVSTSFSFGTGLDASASGTFTYCRAGSQSFGYNGEANGFFIYCQAGNESFGSGTNGTLSGRLYYCRKSDSFVSGGILRLCIDGSNNIITQG